LGAGLKGEDHVLEDGLVLGEDVGQAVEVVGVGEVGGEVLVGPVEGLLEVVGDVVGFAVVEEGFEFGVVGCGDVVERGCDVGEEGCPVGGEVSEIV